MAFKFFSYLFLLVFFQNLNAQVASDWSDFAIDTIAIGDINHDKIVDFAFIKGTKFSDETKQWDDCEKIGCAITISFSCGLPDISFENAVTGSIENIGDIDNDGFDEIVIAPSWIISCWGQLHFYTYKKGKWKKMGLVEQNICNNESFLTLIKKKGKNKIAVEEQVWEDGDRVTKIKILKAK